VGVLALATAAAVALTACSGPRPVRKTSQNGWEVITSARDDRLQTFPWVTGKVRAGDVSTVLGFVAERFDDEVERVDVDSSWGWSYRPVRGGADLSNHASGTAIDLNALAHPLGVRGTFTDDQVSTIHSILDQVDSVVRWGGDYSGRRDDMHFEIVGTEDDVARAAARVHGIGSSQGREP